MRWLLCLLLTACASAKVTPHECREVGVAVPDGAAITGSIAALNIADAAQVRARCQSPFAKKHGCVLGIQPGEYVIWSIDDARVVVHEECHALYEAWTHK